MKDWFDCRNDCFQELCGDSAFSPPRITDEYSNESVICYPYDDFDRLFELKKVDFTITSKRKISEILSNRWIVLNMTRVTTEFEPSVPLMV